MIDKIWTVIEPALTPELVFSMVITLAITHLAKVMAEAFWPAATSGAKQWRAFCAGASVVVGAVVGAVTWLATSVAWPTVPIVAFCSGPAWLLVKALMPRRLDKVKKAFMTATDRKYRRAEE